MSPFKHYGRIVKYTTIDGVKITAMLPLNAPKLYRVAAYCRVSTPHEDQLESLNAQLDYYKNYIRHQLGWVFVGAYADTKSGRSIHGRDQFQQMISDGMDGKFDIIITKTISRFGRNTVDTLSILQKLKEHNIDVYFENENLHSNNGNDELLISLISAVAEAESENRSESIKWGIRRSAENPGSPIYSRPCYGYRKNDDGILSICEEEAKNVRLIFALYLEGHSIVSIKKELESRQIKSPTGKDLWSKRTIENILSNEKYTGNVIIYKTYCASYPNKKRVVNKGQHERLVFDSSHPAIIESSVFEKVQAEKAQRSNLHIDSNGTQTRKPTRYSTKSRI